MFYILTEEEYKNCVPKSKYEEKIKEIEKLQQLLNKTNKETGHTCVYFKMLGNNCPFAYLYYGNQNEFGQ